jgi:hypothetical protein
MVALRAPRVERLFISIFFIDNHLIILYISSHALYGPVLLKWGSPANA